jgi:hypothetical protein
VGGWTVRFDGPTFSRVSTLHDSEPQPKRGPSWGLLILVGLLGWWTLTLGTGLSRWCFLDYVNLAFHEAGHLAFGPCGSTMTYLGGTLGQLLVPVLLGANFLLREGRPHGAAVCVWWLGQSLINVSIYMADARSLALPLVGGGDHDWNELFFRFGLLGEGSVQGVSAATHGLGVVFMLVGLAWTVTFVLPGHRRERLRDALAGRWPWTSVLLDT